ncbi:MULTISPECIES: DUF1016 N-terminal domain-containing protein [Hymenobacter]|uniref:DUF1016 N-terminal domain-containing protein n=1 Tax=Hymenobacter TaxID=89966 RepID=UPI0014047218|nr:MULTISPECIES: DUF1016 N-terminal domain-containing protein [Hymenobacter]QIL78260.1 DUF1016 domain-containing protein [Hymenobacter sp. HDW8]
MGFYLTEYEQHGQDRANYGERILAELAKTLRTRGVTGLSLTNLKLCRQFYQTYPALLVAQAATLQAAGLAFPPIGQTLSDQSNLATDGPGVALPLLLTRLSFSYFIELLALTIPLQRTFYEVQSIKNYWSVRALQRAIDSALYERTGLSTDKAAVLAAYSGAQPLQVAYATLFSAGSSGREETYYSFYCRSLRSTRAIYCGQAGRAEPFFLRNQSTKNIRGCQSEYILAQIL